MKVTLKYDPFVPVLSIIPLVLLAIFGYFLFGGFAGVIAVFGFALLVWLASFTGIIPIAGPMIYILVTLAWINPYWFSITPMSYNWLTWLLWGIELIASIMYTLKSTERLWVKLSE